MGAAERRCRGCRDRAGRHLLPRGEVVDDDDVVVLCQGVRKVRAELSRVGYPPPEVDYSPIGFSLVLRKDPYTREQLVSLGLNERQIASIHHLKSGGSISNQEYQRLYNVKKSTATRDLTAMVQRGIFHKEGTAGAGGRYSLRYAK